MWAIKNYTSFKTGSSWGRNKDGVHEWIVCVKGTFAIGHDGHLVPADEQLEPLLLPEYNGEPGMSSVRYDADLVANKPTTDVVLNGTAYAPGGRRTTSFAVEMRVGPIQKRLKATGDRRWTSGALGGAWSATEPIDRVPIVYERAYGGYDHSDPDPTRHRLDPRNPVGCGVVADSTPRDGQMIANFEYPDSNLEKAGPAGFGAIDSFWSPRREFGGTYDGVWEQSRLPLLPDDWDPRALLCAPADQQPPAHLRGGEVIELINLTPEGRLAFVLPRIHFRFSTHIDGRVEEHRGHLSAVIVEPDQHRVIMAWISSLTCPTDVDYLEHTIVREKILLR